MGENQSAPQPSDPSKELLESAKSPEVIRLERVMALLGSDSRRVLPRDSGGEIVIEREDDRLTVSASLPPSPDWNKYDVKWTLGLIASVPDRVLIEGLKSSGEEERGSVPLRLENETSALDDVLAKAEETAKDQEKSKKQEDEDGRSS